MRLARLILARAREGGLLRKTSQRVKTASTRFYHKREAPPLEGGAVGLCSKVHPLGALEGTAGRRLTRTSSLLSPASAGQRYTELRTALEPRAFVMSSKKGSDFTSRKAAKRRFESGSPSGLLVLPRARQGHCQGLASEALPAHLPRQRAKDRLLKKERGQQQKGLNSQETRLEVEPEPPAGTSLAKLPSTPGAAASL